MTPPINEENPKEFWALNSEDVPFKKGWVVRAFDIQEFMRKVEADSRGGEIIGMEFDGKNIEFYTKLSEQQMKDEVKKQYEEQK